METSRTSPSVSQLAKLTRPALEQLAQDAGVENPGDETLFPTKQALAEAVAAATPEQNWTFQLKTELEDAAETVINQVSLAGHIVIKAGETFTTSSLKLARRLRRHSELEEVQA